jgi:hypothetical protein
MVCVIDEYMVASDVVCLSIPYTAGGKKAGKVYIAITNLTTSACLQRENIRGEFLMTYDNAVEVRT